MKTLVTDSDFIMFSETEDIRLKIYPDGSVSGSGPSFADDCCDSGGSQSVEGGFTVRGTMAFHGLSVKFVCSTGSWRRPPEWRGMWRVEGLSIPERREILGSLSEPAHSELRREFEEAVIARSLGLLAEAKALYRDPREVGRTRREVAGMYSEVKVLGEPPVQHSFRAIIVSELIQGGELRQWIESADFYPPLPLTDLRRLFLEQQLCR